SAQTDVLWGLGDLVSGLLKSEAANSASLAVVHIHIVPLYHHESVFAVVVVIEKCERLSDGVAEFQGEGFEGIAIAIDHLHRMGGGKGQLLSAVAIQVHVLDLSEDGPVQFLLPMDLPGGGDEVKGVAD